jgi:hypothetical protein
MIYSRQLEIEPEEPSLSYLSGNHQAGHFIARSSWREDGTIVTFRSTDHYGDHNHHDQGSFILYRRGLLAVDPPVYRKVRGPQEPTAVHNTLLLGGNGQRDCRGQNFPAVEIFEQNRTAGQKLETGDILFHTEQGKWAAVAGQFAQAYDSLLVESCVRQLLFVRPGTVLVVDHLKAPAGQKLPSVEWLLQVPNQPDATTYGIRASNEKSWLRLVRHYPDQGSVSPAVKATDVGSYTASLGGGVRGQEELLLVHRIEVGPMDQSETDPKPAISRKEPDYFEIVLDGQAFRFNLKSPYAVQKVARWR